MKTFLDLIKSELEEDGEIPFSFLVPYWKEERQPFQIVYPIFDHKVNFEILNKDFLELQSTVKSLIESGNIEICRYHDTHSTKRKDYFRPLNKDEQEEFLKDKSNWIYEKDKPAYFLCKKE